ncbi:FAD-dependent oxidoreductase [Haladaptatus sp. CMAA 1911]|uniref:FAD-dependent oxidoreductase n=1 Tax=unclassified Haladaptatus TaxID=2622732 RepID=UPI003754FF81
MTENHYPIVVVGGTAGGIAAAVRAARNGEQTLLVTYNQHLGGMMAGGLSYTDTLIKKSRAPLLDEFFSSVRDHYRTGYGQDSKQYEFSEDGYICEPHVAEQILEEFVSNEPNLTVFRGYRPVSVTRNGSIIQKVTFEAFDGDSTLQVAGSTFIEATYEGDLMAVAGAAYRVGRESRSEFNEQFAGRLFTGIRGDRYYPRAAVGDGDDTAPMDRRGPLHVPANKQQGDLDIVPHPAGLTEIYPESTGEGDDAIQAYNYRLCLSRDPETRRLPDKPDRYDRAEYLEELDEIIESGVRRYLLLRYLPNEKADMNSADLPGENHDYPDAGWDRRDEIATRHRNYALGLLYFLQNDDAVPDEIRSHAREWGLATDEFTDTDNFPWQLYIREARRLEGRTVFSENDARHAPGLARTPIKSDAVAVAEYPLDSHACHTERQLGSEPEGFFYASQVTRPSQIPYRSMLPKTIDNLLVPVPLSATHVAYGTIRLEPTWMHIGESAGFAAALAEQQQVPPADIDIRELQQILGESGVMYSFFNDVDSSEFSSKSWIPAVQYLGSKGFFDSYHALPTTKLTRSRAQQWSKNTAALLSNSDEKPTILAQELSDGEPDTSILTVGDFLQLLRAKLHENELPPSVLPSDLELNDPISVGHASVVCYRILRNHGGSK